MRKTINRSVLILLAFPVFILAGSINGIFSSSVYSFARQDLDNNSNLHIRSYQSLLLTSNNVGLKNSRSVMSGVFYYDPASDFGDGKSYSFQIYNFNLQKQLFSNHLKIVLGRHTVYTASVFGRMDGLSAEYKRNHLKFTLFGGGYIPGSGFTGNPVNNHLLGTQVKWLRNEHSQLSLGLSNKAHTREIYKSNRTYKNIEVPATLQSRLGIRGFIKKNRVSIHLLTRLEPINFELKDFNAHIDYRYGRIDHLSFEFKFFEPRIPDNSIFSVFDSYSTKEYRLSTDYKLSEKLTGSFQFRIVQFNNDYSQILNLAVRNQHIFVQLTNQKGYGGSSTHITGQISEQFKRTILYSRASIGNYRLIEGDLNDLASLVLGARLPLYSRMFVKTELQILKNKYYAKDVRLLLNLSHRI